MFGGLAIVVAVWGSSALRGDESSPAATPTAATTLAPTVERLAPPTELTVSSVKDGDTVYVSDGREVRLAQVDAPERNECYGSQSTAALSKLAFGKPVELRRPSNGPEHDKYGRTLAELRVDGKSIDEELVRSGAAEWYEQFAHEDADIARRLQAAEADARAARRGLWSACKEGAASPPREPSPAAPPSVQRFAAAPSGSNCHPAYPDDCLPPSPDLDCGTIGHRVRVDRAHGDPHRLDADRDGWGCESR